MELVTPAVSLACVDALLQRLGALMLCLVDDPTDGGVRDHRRVVRPSVGLEDTDDRWADLDDALAAVREGERLAMSGQRCRYELCTAPDERAAARASRISR